MSSNACTPLRKNGRPVLQTNAWRAARFMIHPAHGPQRASTLPVAPVGTRSSTPSCIVGDLKPATSQRCKRFFQASRAAS